MLDHPSDHLQHHDALIDRLRGLCLGEDGVCVCVYLGGFWGWWLGGYRKSQAKLKRSNCASIVLFDGTCTWMMGLILGKQGSAVGACYVRWQTYFFPVFFSPFLLDTSWWIKQLPFDAAWVSGVCGQLQCRLFLHVSSHLFHHWNWVRFPLFLRESPVHPPPPSILPLRVPA